MLWQVSDLARLFYFRYSPQQFKRHAAKLCVVVINIPPWLAKGILAIGYYISHMKLTARQIASIQKYFSGQPVLRAYVFGSYARGDADEKSDIDILLQLDYSQKIGLRYVRMQLDLEKLLHKRVDFSSEDFLKPRIKDAIQREKQLLYEKSTS